MWGEMTKYGADKKNHCWCLDQNKIILVLKKDMRAEVSLYQLKIASSILKSFL